MLDLIEFRSNKCIPCQMLNLYSFQLFLNAYSICTLTKLQSTGINLFHQCNVKETRWLLPLTLLSVNGEIVNILQRPISRVQNTNRPKAWDVQNISNSLVGGYRSTSENTNRPKAWRPFSVDPVYDLHLGLLLHVTWTFLHLFLWC